MLNILLTSDLTLALEIIHQLKCVHQDVSMGNILLYQGTGQLSDLGNSLPYDPMKSKQYVFIPPFWQVVPFNTTA